MSSALLFTAVRFDSGLLYVTFQEGAAEPRQLFSYYPPERPSTTHNASKFAAFVLLAKAVGRDEAQLYYEAFNRDVVSRLSPNGWSITEREIRDWTDRQSQQAPKPAA